MTSKQDTSELVELIRQGEMFQPGTEVVGGGGIEMMATLLKEYGHPDFVTVMVGHDGIAREFPGVSGFREALSDWISPYEEFRLVIDEVLIPEDKLVFLVRQVGTTKHDGVEIENESGSVWGLVDGRIRQATFYLDQRGALEAAGIDPDSR